MLFAVCRVSLTLCMCGIGPRHQANVPANLPPLTVKEPPQSTEEDSSQSTFEPQRDHEPLTDRPVASAGYATNLAAESTDDLIGKKAHVALFISIQIRLKGAFC